MNFSKRRYRRKVAFFKIISAIALGSIIALIYYNMLSNPKAEESKTESKVSVSYGISVSDSLFEGSDRHGKKYQLASKSLVKKSDDLYDLETIDGKYSLEKADIDFEAHKGKMDDNTKLLKLVHNIVIKYGGYLLLTDQMDIDLNRMYAHNNKQVSVLYRNSKIKADRFTLDTDSDTIHFEGNVLTRFKVSDF